MVNALTSNSYMKTSNPIQPINASQSSILSTSSNRGTKATVDKATLSNKNNFSLIYDRSFSIQKGCVTIESIKNDLSNTTYFVEKNIQSIYRQLDIPLSTQMKIRVGRDGSIIVNGNSPQSEKLAEEINKNKDLSNAIRRMSMLSSVLEAIRKHKEFVDAYNKDPFAAVERYGSLLEDGHDYHVIFLIKDGSIDTTVEYI